MINALKALGFDTDLALEYLGSDEDLYRTILADTRDEAEEKIPLLEECFANRDFGRYHIEVHALKNVANMIGAMKLFTLSNAQNTRGLNKDEEGMWANHEPMMVEYRALLSALKGMDLE